jgi:hypothetical protein
MRTRISVALVAAIGLVVAATTTPSGANPLSGAIFTTVADGSEVNFNQYAAKEDVYLDGGPGPQAPQGAAGLPDGTYVFQVTDPSGKTLLSMDKAACRRFTVAGGIITGVLAGDGCTTHVTGADIDHGAVTVQLMPYLDTPNNGGVYKVWAEPLSDFTENCAALGVAHGLDAVDCGARQGNRHGFIGSDSKTDNFKVKNVPIIEIDTRFFRNGIAVDGLRITWTDTNGASNGKWSYYAPSLNVFHEAHVEGPEPGTHVITIANQTGCNVGDVTRAGVRVGTGPQSVPVNISPNGKESTVFIDVTCTT